MRMTMIFSTIGLVGCVSGSSDEPLDDSGLFTTGAPLTCDEVDRTQAGQVVERAPEMTMSGVYRISERFILDGDEVVTIEPGTVFLVEPDVDIFWGWRNDPVKVTINGTADAPVLFCGTNPGPGSWTGIQLLGGLSTDSRFTHVRVEDAGQNDLAALYLENAHDLVSVALVGNAAVGLEAWSLGDGSSQITATDNEWPAHLHSGAAISNLPEGDYAGNDDDAILVSGQGGETVTYHNRGVPYRQLDDRVIYGSADGADQVVTFAPGVEYQFCQHCTLYTGWRGDPTTVVAVGTPDEPIVFTSADPSPSPGDWNGILWLTGTDSASRLQHARLEYGGKAELGSNGDANLVISGGLGQLDNVTFASSGGYGLSLYQEEPGFVLGTSLSFEGNLSGDINDLD